MHNLLHTRSQNCLFVIVANMVKPCKKIYICIKNAADAFPRFHKVNNVCTIESCTQKTCILYRANRSFCPQCFNVLLPVGLAASYSYSMSIVYLSWCKCFPDVP